MYKRSEEKSITQTPGSLIEGRPSLLDGLQDPIAKKQLAKTVLSIS